MTNRSLVRVTSLERKSKHLLMVNSIEEALEGAIRKLQLDNATTWKLFVESGDDAGLEVEDDEVLVGLASCTTLILCAVPADSEWHPPSGEPSSPFATPVQHQSVQSSGIASNGSHFQITPTGSRSNGVQPLCSRNITSGLHENERENPDDPGSSGEATVPQFITFIESGHQRKIQMPKIVEILDEALEEVNMLPPRPDINDVKDTAVRKVAKVVMEQMWNDLKSNYTLDTCRVYATAVMNFQKKTYEGVYNVVVLNTTCSSGHRNFSTKLYNMMNYEKNLKGDKTTKKSKRRATEEPVVTQSSKKVRVRRVRGAFCCPNYSVPLPPDENEESQENKRQELITAHVVGDYGPDTMQLIKRTYATQRKEINASDPIALLNTSFMPRWPILSNGSCFLVHCSELTRPKEFRSEWNCQEIFDKQVASLVDDIMNYMEDYWLTKKRAKRPCKSTERAPAMLQLIKAVTDENVETRSRKATSIAVFQLVCNYMKEDTDYMISRVNASASEEEILAAASIANENPIIIIKGDSLYDSDVRCEVRVLDQIVISTADVVEAYLVWFMAFHAFDFCYTKEVQCTLEFIQRFFLGLNVEGDRRENPRRNVSEVDRKVVDLATAIRNATSPWSLEYE